MWYRPWEKPSSSNPNPTYGLHRAPNPKYREANYAGNLPTTTTAGSSAVPYSSTGPYFSASPDSLDILTYHGEDIENKNLKSEYHSSDSSQSQYYQDTFSQVRL